MSNHNQDNIPEEYIPLPKRAPIQTHDLIEMERIASTQNKHKPNQNKKRNLIQERPRNGNKKRNDSK